ncbi:MAG TPA: MGMT family protein [Verrucomicrobiae bacterium]|nr:MGMT family protein [Verrucomicrobiae bacterium]
MQKIKIDWSEYTPFQQKVLKIVAKIPRGKVLTYSQIALMIGKPGAARAVGNAVGSNRHAPFIPCHRVVGYNSLGGYSAPGGIETKKLLLKKEGYLVK